MQQEHLPEEATTKSCLWLWFVSGLICSPVDSTFGAVELRVKSGPDRILLLTGQALSINLAISLWECVALCACSLADCLEDLTGILQAMLKSHDRTSRQLKDHDQVHPPSHLVRVQVAEPYFSQTCPLILSVFCLRDNLNATSKVMDHNRAYWFFPLLHLLLCSRPPGNQGWLISKSPEEMSHPDFCSSLILSMCLPSASLLRVSNASLSRVSDAS